MSTNYYYRVDALRNDGKAGDVVFARATNQAGAIKSALQARPDLADDWTLTPVKIKKEDYPVAVEYEELVIPPINEVIPGADPENPTMEDTDAYNAWATETVQKRLEELKAGGMEPPHLRTRYPHDSVTLTVDSRDLVSLGRHGEVVVVDEGDF